MSEKTCPTPEPFHAVIGSILLLTFLFFLTFISRFIFAPLMPAIGKDLGITSSQAGSVFLMGSFGFFFASLLSVALLRWFSWQVTLVCLGFFSLAVGVYCTRFARFGDFPGDVPGLLNTKTILSQRSFWIMVILFALGMGGQVGIYAMLPLYLVTERGMESGLANSLLGLSQISALFMTFFAGWVTDRLGEKPAIALFLSASGIVTILLGIASGTWLKVVVFVQPALIVCYFPAGFSALARIVQPNLRSLATALATPTAFVIGGGILPAALGYMGQAYTFGLGIALAGCLILLGPILVAALKLLDKMEDGC